MKRHQCPNRPTLLLRELFLLHQQAEPAFLGAFIFLLLVYLLCDVTHEHATLSNVPAIDKHLGGFASHFLM
jgi:hypothetical protein